tara:strand:+ start:266 stop:433 length:168 start_codon:yes stop_codon:yes gene_type:complete
LSSYEIEIDGDVWTKERSKDDVIESLMGYINGDGAVRVKVTYPDGSYYLYTGEGE